MGESGATNVLRPDDNGPYVEVPGSDSTKRQLRRQAVWLKESYRWLLKTKVMANIPEGTRLSALDVGCGPGFVMDELRDDLRVSGEDMDADMVTACTARGLDVREASVYDLPHGDGDFDIVYCTFLLMWLDDPGSALAEMARVSKGWVLCLAEPDFGARIDHPEELHEVRDLVVKGFRDRGADPYMGRKLRELYLWAGMTADMGIHPGVWDVSRLRQEFPDEWSYVSRAAPEADPERMRQMREAWERALEMGTLLSFNPIFYALGSK